MYSFKEATYKSNPILILLKDGEPVFDGAEHIKGLRFGIKKAKMSRDQFMGELKARNVGTGLHFRAVHTQKYYREAMNVSGHVLENTQWNSERLCSLPLFPDMVIEDIHDVVNAIKDVLKK